MDMVGSEWLCRKAVLKGEVRQYRRYLDEEDFYRTRTVSSALISFNLFPSPLAIPADQPRIVKATGDLTF